MITVPQDNEMEKLQRIKALYDKLGEQYKDEIAHIDLRYEHGLSVRWKSPERMGLLIEENQKKRREPS
jgi:cell division septal protein FtsQ